MNETKLAVSEAFKSIQGEGPTMGVPSYFLRLAGCNLLCGGQGTDKDGNLHDGAEWRCDTIEVWQHGNKRTTSEIIEMFGERFIDDINDNCHLIITGGEPLIQQLALKAFFKELKLALEFIPYIEVETNGTIAPDPELIEYVGQWNVSPKLKNSGMSWNKRNSRMAMRYFADSNDSIFKFVIMDQSDWLEVLQDWMAPNDLDGERVWLMPAAESREQLVEISAEIAEICRDHNINFSSRLQLINWDKATGV